MHLCLFVYDSLGTPDTNRRGLRTLNARSALTSKPAAFPPIGVPPSPFVACSNIALNNLWERETEAKADVCLGVCYFKPIQLLKQIMYQLQ